MTSISVNASAPFMDRLVDFVFTRNSIDPDQHPIFKVSALRLGPYYLTWHGGVPLIISDVIGKYNSVNIRGD